ncbi:MAG: Omp85 family outer membrane protein [Mangrovibacterium sp.]
MKTRLFIILSIFLSSTSFAQENEANTSKESIMKEGWNFGGIPAVSYDADRGFMYGVITNLYHYGDGSRYPQYDHSLYLELVRYTGGTTNLEFQYDSDKLFKGLITTANLCYKVESLYQFYGFNGYQSVYNEGWTDRESEDYFSRAFYNYDRRQIRARFNFQGSLVGDALRWQAGIGFQAFNISPFDAEAYNEKKDDDKEIDTEHQTLLELYQAAGIISEEEADGGNIPAINAGLIYDSRDFASIPQKGVWAVANLEWVPDILGAEGGFARLGLSYSQYIKLIDKHRLTFAYRAAWQTTLWGEAPFYYTTQWVNPDTKGATKEGLGGSTSLRGILRNRVIGKDIAYGNFELRSRILNFQAINQNFFIGTNVFCDMGKVTKSSTVRYDSSFNLSSMNLPSTNKSDYFNNQSDKWHVAYGAGLKVGMNDNFVVSLDYGIAADKRDGSSGFYMEIDYLF